MEIDDFHGSSINNCNDVREQMMSSNKLSSRMVSMSSSKASVDYATRIERLNNFLNNEEVKEPIDNLQLFHMAIGGQDNQVSKVANSSSSREQQHVFNKNLALNRATNSNKHVFNVQILYDVNQILDAELWDSSFHAILLHRSMEHLASDIRHIKESLQHIQKYILNKLIKDDKANNINDLEDVSKAAQGFIPALYKSHWDYLITDKNNFSFRYKVKAITTQKPQCWLIRGILYKVYTRELDRKLCTRLSTLYIQDLWSVLAISTLL